MIRLDAAQRSHRLALAEVCSGGFHVGHQFVAAQSFTPLEYKGVRNDSQRGCQRRHAARGGGAGKLCLLACGRRILRSSTQVELCGSFIMCTHHLLQACNARRRRAI